MPATFSSSIASVYRVVNGLEYFKRLSSQARTRLSIDITFVGLALRTGCLIDTFSPESPTNSFSALLDALQCEPTTKSLASNIAHLYESASDQSFLVNAPLLRHRIEKSLAPEVELAPLLTPVRLFPGSRCELERCLPSKLTGVLGVLLQSLELTSGRADSITLPNDIDMEVAVPLAALILDYSVAYIPTSTPGGVAPVFLSSVPMRTYECVLTFDPHTAPSSRHGRERASVMKFSCPQSLEEGERGVSPGVVVDELNTLFGGRLAKIGDETAAFEFVCGSITLDRLAL